MYVCMYIRMHVRMQIIRDLPLTLRRLMSTIVDVPHR